MASCVENYWLSKKVYEIPRVVHKMNVYNDDLQIANIFVEGIYNICLQGCMSPS